MILISRDMIRARDRPTMDMISIIPRFWTYSSQLSHPWAQFNFFVPCRLSKPCKTTSPRDSSFVQTALPLTFNFNRTTLAYTTCIYWTSSKLIDNWKISSAWSKLQTRQGSLPYEESWIKSDDDSCAKERERCCYHARWYAENSCCFVASLYVAFS